MKIKNNNIDPGLRSLHIRSSGSRIHRQDIIIIQPHNIDERLCRRERVFFALPNELVRRVVVVLGRFEGRQGGGVWYDEVQVIVPADGDLAPFARARDVREGALRPGSCSAGFSS